MDVIKKTNYIENSILNKMNSINDVRNKINKNAKYSDFIELRDLLMDVSLYFDDKFTQIEELLNKLEPKRKHN